jgi:serine phosphatase RsbU (regulator of sigma subunit)
LVCQSQICGNLKNASLAASDMINAVLSRLIEFQQVAKIDDDENLVIVKR